MEKRGLTTFGTWLCDRAAAYQNAYSLATEQLTGAAPRAPFPRQIARVNQIYSKGKEGVFMKRSSRPFCFKCKGEHKLENCESFLALEAYEDFVSICVIYCVMDASDRNTPLETVSKPSHVKKTAVAFLIIRYYTTDLERQRLPELQSQEPWIKQART